MNYNDYFLKVEKSCFNCKFCIFDSSRELYICSLDFDSFLLDNSDAVLPYMYCDSFKQK